MVDFEKHQKWQNFMKFIHKSYFLENHNSSFLFDQKHLTAKETNHEQRTDWKNRFVVVGLGTKDLG